MAQTYVLGGFGREGDGEAEKDWLASKIKDLHGNLESVYFKGGEYKGLLFAKFKNAETACSTMEAFEKSKPKFDDNEIWCKPETPVERRAVRGLLLCLRWMLGEWGFNTKKQSKPTSKPLQ